VSFYGSVGGKFDVNIKINDFVANISQSKFYFCCYILLYATRPNCQYRHTYQRSGYATLGPTVSET